MGRLRAAFFICWHAAGKENGEHPGLFPDFPRFLSGSF
jgi:hypothetical protein